MQQSRLTPAVTGAFAPSKRAELLACADAILGDPPASAFTERHPSRGALVIRFVLPLEMARPLNRTRHAKAWQMDKHREVVLTTMRTQWLKWGGAVSIPLPGRPQMRAIRFSSVQPDSTAAWWKEAIDVLLLPRMRRGRRVDGVGVLVDDRPSKLETRAWWEKVRASEGFALIELWTGET